MQRDFSITFWIRLEKNPKWSDGYSDIDFPPINKDGIQIYFSKRKDNFIVFILHPAIGYRKISANVRNYLGKDAFVALTNSNTETKLYLNADLLKTVSSDTLIDQVDIGDYIMVIIQRGDISKPIAENINQIIAPAKVVSFDGDDVVVDLITIGEIIKVPKTRIKV